MKRKHETTVALTSLRLNDGSFGLPKNPRFIRDDRFMKLVQSIKEFPEAMPARGIVVDERGVILGGTMRFRACKELGMKLVPASWIRVVNGLSDDQKRRFILMDNRHSGEDDADALRADFTVEKLLSAGIQIDVLEVPEGSEEETVETLKPIKRLHVLLVMTADQGLDVLPELEAIAKSRGIEVHHAGN